MSSERTFINLIRQVHPYVMADRLYVAFFDNFYMFAISFGIGFGAFVAAFIVHRLILYFGLPSGSRPKFRLARSKHGEKRLETHDPRTGHVSWKKISAHSNDIEAQRDAYAQHKPLFYSVRSSVVHFTALTIKYAIIVFGLYTAFGVAGVSFFSLAFSVGIIGLIGTYAFGLVLYNISGAFVVFGTGKFTEGMVIKMRGVKGTIMEMTSFFVTLRCKDPQTGEVYMANIPNRYFNEDLVLRFPAEETGMENFEATTIEGPMVTPNKITVIKSE
jgi:small-conductance mechanosensitive channel